MKKGSIMKKSLIHSAVYALMFATSITAFAQEKSNPFGQANPNQENQNKPVAPVAPKEVNTLPNNGSTTINYNSGAANLNGEKTVLPQNVTNLPNGLPNQPAAGLPVDSTQIHRQQDSSKIDPIEATINILNTPNQKIKELNKDLYNKGKVINQTATVAPRISNGVIVARLEPNSISPVIRLGKNRTTVITLTDMTGQPWPIINYDGLSEEDFTVKRLDNPAPDGYVLSITPKGAFVSGNLALVLKGLPTPISIDFVSAQKEVDGTTQVRVQAKGPNTQFSSISLPDSIDTNLLSILQGVAPNGAIPLKTSSAAVQAWKAKDGAMYLRTRYKVMSPAFEHVTSSPDGTYAYKMIPVSVVLYKAAEGRFGQFNVDGF